MGASMGALQSYEWAAAYPGMVQRIVPVIGAPEIDAYSVGWLNIWAAPIMLDPQWNHGDYYGKDEPVEGLALALKTVTLHARHHGWAARTFGRKWAAPDKDPAKSWDSKFAIEDTLDKVALARARASDANSFLYLAKANQLFVTGHKRGARGRAQRHPRQGSPRAGAVGPAPVPRVFEARDGDLEIPGAGG
jgi:homoserine O-acetyltransferase/O-succinyltransferase